jgi:hypothetical protein
MQCTRKFEIQTYQAWFQTAVHVELTCLNLWIGTWYNRLLL